MDNLDKLMLLIDEQDLDGALRFVSELPDSNAETWYLRGKVYSRMGNMSEAMSSYYKALEVDPNYEEARVMIDISQRIYSFKDPNLFNH